MFEPWVFVILALVGLAAGTFGGMLGVGGSIIIIPALVILFGQGAEHPGLFGGDPAYHQHLYQAAAMIINVLVLAPAAVRHYRAEAIDFMAVRRILPIALGFIVVGVMVSNLPLFRPGEAGPVWLGRLMAVLLIYVIALNIRKLFDQGHRTEQADAAKRTWARGVAVGGPMGFFAGLFGIGGGAIAVPLMNSVMRLPLRRAVASSALIITASASLGAIIKNTTLPESTHVSQSLLLVTLLGPTVLVGGYLGASLTHRLPIRPLRIIFIALLMVAAWRMLKLDLF